MNSFIYLSVDFGHMYICDQHKQQYEDNPHKKDNYVITVLSADDWHKLNFHQTTTGKSRSKYLRADKNLTTDFTMITKQLHDSVLLNN